MKLRTAITLTILGALAVALLATTVVVSRVLTEAAHRQLSQQLAQESASLADMLRYRKSLHRAETRMLADEPRLKAVVSTDDVTSATVQGVVVELKRALRCDLLIVTDRSGIVLADSAHADAEGASLAANPALSRALQTGESEDVWIDESTLLQVQARRISFGSVTVGAVVVGYKIDDALADSVAKHLGADILLLHEAKVAASSAALRGLPQDIVKRLVAVDRSKGSAVVSELAWQGHHHLVQLGALPDYSGRQQISYALFRSLDAALAPAHRLLRILYGITSLAMLVSLFLSLWLSHRLSQPIDALVGFAHRIAEGKLQPAGITGMNEVKLLGDAMDQMVRELAASRQQMAEKSRLAKEMEIAERIQLSILPRTLSVKGLEITAQMTPASEVGGDYYDVIPCPDGGCWIAIGDVAGHGLPAGLVMMMLQSALSALVRALPNATPRQIVPTLNRLLFDNIRNRMGSDEHVTFTAARYHPDGRLVFAGAHEYMLLLRHGQRSCEQVETPGTWLAVIEDIGSATTDHEIQLQPGDTLCLYTDGITEAFDDQKKQFGLSGLSSVLIDNIDLPLPKLHDAVTKRVSSWCAQPSDDQTLILLRREVQNEQK